jgi:hypothetical protein
VRQQVEVGIDVVNDGEFGKPMSDMSDEVDYRVWRLSARARNSCAAWNQSSSGDPSGQPLACHNA